MTIDSSQLHKYGVLFVHGVGEQKRGETLSSAANPMLAWLRSWLGFSGVGKISQNHTLLDINAAGDPAHLEFELNINNPHEEHRWVFAESHWAESFIPPTSLALFVWVISVGPALLLHRIHRLLQSKILDLLGAGLPYRGTGKPLRPILQVVVFIALIVAVTWMGMRLPAYFINWPAAAGVLALLYAGLHMAILGIGVVLLLALALSAIPIHRVSTIAKGVVATLTSYLGDGYLAVHDDVGLNAILSKIASDIHWLRKRGCKRIAIVAHSQGACLVHRLLATKLAFSKTRQLDFLITYGSGEHTLEDLNRLTHRRIEAIVLSSLILATSLLPLGLVTMFGNSCASACSIPIHIFAFLAIVILVIFHTLTSRVAVVKGIGIGGAGYRPAESRNRFDQTVRRLFEAYERTCLKTSGRTSRKFEYVRQDAVVDIYARMDFATEGRGSSTFVNQDQPPQRVRNQDSILDHSTFWQNAEQFVPFVTRSLLKKIGGVDLINKAPTDCKPYFAQSWIARSRIANTAFTLGQCAGLSALIATFANPEGVSSFVKQITSSRAIESAGDWIWLQLQTLLRFDVGTTRIFDESPWTYFPLLLLFTFALMTAATTAASVLRSIWESLMRAELRRYDPSRVQLANQPESKQVVDRLGAITRSMQGVMILIGAAFAAAPWLLVTLQTSDWSFLQPMPGLTILGAVFAALLTVALILRGAGDESEDVPEDYPGAT
jgi:hypothetical protein